MLAPLIRLQCGVNSYEWGKRGQSSCAARYAATTPPPDFSIQPSQPYAELWMGTHPSNPSYDATTGRTLLELIQDNEALLTPSILSQYGRQLPFLFKILSIEHALSIQAHPNKKLAKQLHARDPVNYPDENHKPEMAIAITPFEALCGFRPLQEIAHFLVKVPSLRALVGEDKATRFQLVAEKCNRDVSAETKHAEKQALQGIFATVMEAPGSLIKASSETLLASAKMEGENFAGVKSTSGWKMAELVCRLHAQYGPDRGLFVLFFLNFVMLQPGEALYLQADDIHAYISGDIVECMATSDNVVRAGLTNRFKDVPTLVDMLTYNFAPIEEQTMKPIDFTGATLNQTAKLNGSFTALYDPPIDEFAVIRTVLKGIGADAAFASLCGPSIIICITGKGRVRAEDTTMDLEEGRIYFVSSDAACVIESMHGEPLEVYTAFCQSK